MKVLIVGAGGQLGRSLPGALAGHELIAVRRAELDITSGEDVRRTLAAERPGWAINAAAYNRVDEAETDPTAAFAVNEQGARNLAEAGAELGIRLVHVSSDYVFDGAASEPYDENACPGPLSVYGKSKLAGEQAVLSASPRHAVVRTSWLYHERGRNFPLTMIELAKRGPVRVVDDQRGSPTYAPHLARGIARLLESGAAGLFHMAGQGAASWYELTCALYARLHIRTPIIPVATAEFPRPARRPRFSALTTTREPRLLLPPWEQGLDEFVARLRGS